MRSTVLATALYSLLLLSEGSSARPSVHELRRDLVIKETANLVVRAPQNTLPTSTAAATTTDCDQNNLAARQGGQGGGGRFGGGRFGGGRFGGGGFGGGRGNNTGGGAGGNGAVVSSSAPPSTSSPGNNGAAQGNGQGGGQGGNAGQGQGQGQSNGNGQGSNGQGNNGQGGQVNNGQGNNGQGGNNGQENSGQGNNGQGNNGQGNNGQGNNGQGNNGQQNDNPDKGGDNSGNNGQNNNNNGAAAPPVAGNENGQPGPSVPQLEINGGLTLDRSLLLNNVAGGNATAGEAQSAVSNNNFISGKTLTDGLQVQGGSCAVTPIGDIPSTANLVSTFFTSPKNGEQLKAGQTFTISLAVQGMVLGSFTNAKTTYYKAPQQLSGGKIVGHAHVTIQKMSSADSTAILPPGVFAFFKGLDFGDVNGISSVDVVGGLTAGAYRICTIMSNSNHASVILPVAQRGAENTCSYFNVA